MTCIVGIESGGKVYIGADAAGSGGTSIAIMTDPKVFRRGRFVIGYTSSFRMGQLLEHTLKPPAYTAEWQKRGLSAFMTVRFIDAVRKCLSDGGFNAVKNERIEGGTFLVGYRGSLFAVHDDYQVGRVADGYYAVGCGADLALGSMHTTESMLGHRSDRVVRRRLEMALQAAARFSTGVAGPFTIEVSA